MNRLLLLAIGTLMALGAAAQQPGSDTPNSNRETPAINAPAAVPTSPNGTAPQKPAAANAPASTAPSTPPKAPASAPGNPATAQPAVEQPAAQEQPSQPTTEMLPQGTDLPSSDPVLEAKELPKKEMSLIGGTATKVDKIRNRVQLQPFGGGKKVSVRFDDRSHIYRDGRETTATGINAGDRIYVDTMLVDGHVFARNLRVVTKSGPAESRGQVVTFDAKTGRVNLRDSLTGQPVIFFVSKQTAMSRRGKPASPGDIKPGALLDVMFAPGRHGGTADQIALLAVPGEDFIFSGRVTNLDLSRGILAVDNASDDRNYEVHFDPASLDDRNALRVGTEITARAQFDGRSYHANQVMVMRSNAQQ